MNILVQFFIILVYSFVGDIIHTTFNLPIPGSIIGLVLLFISLKTKILKLESIERAGNWLKSNMALLFVPITVGIMPYFNVIQKNWVEVTLIMVISTIITYLVTAFIAEYILKKEDKKNA